MSEIKLYDYWRSSASYRVRIALNLKGLRFETEEVNLLNKEQNSDAYKALNPQGLVPTLVLDGQRFTQSLAIIEYLEEQYPEPKLMPEDALGRARVRQLSYAIAMDIHPICNLGVVQSIVHVSGGNETIKAQWMKEKIRGGLVAFEGLLEQLGTTGATCYGETVSLADICLMPQVYNADRWGADRSDLPRINTIVSALEHHPAFAAAYPKSS
ncbi:maleylacetoacetate isomerase [Pseudovibrio exalbescens]|uniref:maleylacetoacetate isomerase n=1 Tax=Pseudovibrio exalbescens TaxID=197461 RepID=UPI002365BB8A|nr:maleylacetoacetate isomerase [Pseudovibrio exalbescens]MDD7909863.1 maleylacetoacetate isomerase [Pseudovibrio exalbescens]